MSQFVRQKQLSLRIKSAAAPSEEQLAQIRAFTLADIPAEELYSRTFVLAHSGIDRDKQCFSDAILADFARTLPGKGLFLKHPLGWDGDTGPGEGRWYAAEVQRMSHDEARKLLREPGLQFAPDAADAAVLVASAYMVRTDENAALLKKVDAGIASDVSISFSSANGPVRLRNAQGIELNAWRWDGPGEALEGSLVWLGAQPGARAFKNAGNRNQENAVSDHQKQIDDANAKAAAAEAKAEAHRKAAEQYEALKSALGEDAALLEKPQDLKAAIEAGREYRKSLVDDIVAAERRMGLVGDDDAAVSAAKQLHEGSPTSRLKALADHYVRSAGASGPESKGSVRGSDPNAAKGTKPAEGELANPLLAG